MDLILKEEIAGLGKQGEKVKVKDGYARNYLIPKGLALEASPASLKIIELQRKQKIQKEQERKCKAQKIAEKLANISCTIAMSAGEGDRLYGTVTNSDITEALAQENIVVDKKDIIFEEEVHKLGIYYFNVRLHPEITQRMKLWVVKK